MTVDKLERSIEIIKIKGNDSLVVLAKGFTDKDTESLNKMFGEDLIFKTNQKEDAVEIRSSSAEYSAVHLAVDMQEELGFLWKNSKNLGFRSVPSSAVAGRRARSRY